MKRGWIWILALGALVFFWTRIKQARNDVRSPVTGSEVEQPGGETVQHPMPTPTLIEQKQVVNTPLAILLRLSPSPDQQRTANDPPAKEQPNPYHIDRFSVRQLSLPNPKSISELLNKLTDYKDPMLPVVLPGQGEDGDGDVLTTFRGFYELPNGEMRKILYDRSTDDASVAIEEVDGKTHQWTRSRGELSFKNFNDDPYALVIFLPAPRMIYLKFRSHTAVEGTEGSDRNMIGWIFSDRNATAQTTPVAMYESGPTWPAPDAIRSLLPKHLPAQ